MKWLQPLVRCVEYADIPATYEIATAFAVQRDFQVLDTHLALPRISDNHGARTGPGTAMGVALF